jgi:glycosyltransferase involved in cell wall biosynthesis
MKNLITVVIPAYNRARVIKNAINSVLSQTYQNFEIVVVDDGSTDQTEQIINNKKNRDSRIRYIKHSINQGAQAARNTGIKNACGEWITFLDSDDCLIPNSLEVRLKKAIDQKINVIHSECYVIRNNNQPILFGVPPLQGNIYYQLLCSPGPVFPALLIAKEALKKIDYLDEKIIAYQEWDTVIRLAKFYEFGFVEIPTFTYDCRGQDTISKNLQRGVVGYKQIINKHKKEIFKIGGIKAISQHCLNLSSQLKNIDKNQSFFYMVIGLIYVPNLLYFVYLKLSNFLKKLS